MTPLLKPTITQIIAPLHAAVLRNTLLQIANAEYPNKELTEGEFTLHLQEMALTALIVTGTAEVNASEPPEATASKES